MLCNLLILLPLLQEKTALYEEMLVRHSRDLDEAQRAAEAAEASARAEREEAVRVLEARLAELEARAAASGWTDWNNKVRDRSLPTDMIADQPRIG